MIQLNKVLTKLDNCFRTALKKQKKKYDDAVKKFNERQKERKEKIDEYQQIINGDMGEAELREKIKEMG